MIRGEIWWADLGIHFGSEPGFERPVLIIQADSFNKSRINTSIIVPFTTNLALADVPGNVYVDIEETDLSKVSVIIVSQISVIDKRRLIRKHSKITHRIMNEVEQGIALVLNFK